MAVVFLVVFCLIPVLAASLGSSGILKDRHELLRAFYSSVFALSLLWICFQASVVGPGIRWANGAKDGLLYLASIGMLILLELIFLRVIEGRRLSADRQGTAAAIGFQAMRSCSFLCIVLVMSYLFSVLTLR